jgi:hypothetical protein
MKPIAGVYAQKTMEHLMEQGFRIFRETVGRVLKISPPNKILESDQTRNIIQNILSESSGMVWVDAVSPFRYSRNKLNSTKISHSAVEKYFAKDIVELSHEPFVPKILVRCQLVFERLKARDSLPLRLQKTWVAPPCDTLEHS